MVDKVQSCPFTPKGPILKSKSPHKARNSVRFDELWTQHVRMNILVVEEKNVLSSSIPAPAGDQALNASLLS